MRVIIAGTRSFNNPDMLAAAMDRFAELYGPVDVVISGGARGADTLGERWAQKRGIHIVRMPADWPRYGRAAGAIRNGEMVAQADGLVAFWDGASRGTADVMRQAREKHLHVLVWQYSGFQEMSSDHADLSDRRLRRESELPD